MQGIVAFVPHNFVYVQEFIDLIAKDAEVVFGCICRQILLRKEVQIHLCCYFETQGSIVMAI